MKTLVNFILKYLGLHPIRPVSTAPPFKGRAIGILSGIILHYVELSCTLQEV